MVERFDFMRIKLGKYWLVQLAIGTKRKINEMFKACPMDTDGLCTRDEFNIIHLGLYDFLIGMDWLYEHHDIMDYYNK
jgi:hypothetical protein